MKQLYAAMIAVSLIAAGPVAADEAKEEKQGVERAEELAREAVTLLMRTLRGLIDAIPQYAAPELTDDGDIIIRRIRPEEESPEIPEDLPSPDPGDAPGLEET